MDGDQLLLLPKCCCDMSDVSGAERTSADSAGDTGVESLPEMEELTSEVAELKEHSHRSDEDFRCDGVL